ncbi:hypothetical protein AB1Y20_001971 [Prymnesium parvum]|uniref:Uncharacterized protein n=1 Tax=Prymnesium parvum TaxID=97485 RepID=A0AB34JA63_PRYPA
MQSAQHLDASLRHLSQWRARRSNSWVVPRYSPDQTASQSSRRRKVAKRGRTRTTGTEVEMIALPKHWFSEPLRHSMKTVVRPPTARTRRKQQTIKAKVPEETFFDLMKPLETGCTQGFEWIDAEKTRLMPTAEKPSYILFKYTFARPSVLDQIWRLEEETATRKKDKDGCLIPFRRGHGCARLHLSHAAADGRGERTDLIAQVTGNTTITFKVPKLKRAMPSLCIKVSVSSMDRAGHVVWANTYSTSTAAALRKQMRHHLTHMIESSEYPTLTHMSSALTHTSDEVRTS